MALNQAQDLAAAKYKLVLNVPLSERAYIVDMIYGGKGDVGISVGRTPVRSIDNPKSFDRKTDSKIRVTILSNDGCYLGFKPKDTDDYMYGVIHETESSVLVYNLHYNPESPQPSEVWPILEQCDGKYKYSPQGIVACKSGVILICLWNNEVGERSFGKVVSDRNDFEIFTDKNRPLFVFPTYITENGNGDICVSDVGAVVVTDAGGMLRFRYQGTSPNFEPYGLCCDSVCNIIIADMKNDKIHMIDKDGGFLRYVMYEGIKMPRALCIDTRDRMYVGEWNTDSIKILSR